MRRWLGATILLVVALLGGSSPGDEVVLVGGGRLSCEILEEDEHEIVVRLPNGTMVIPRDRVVSLRRESRGEYLMREGAQSLKTGSTKDALDLYKRALKEDPDDPDAQRGHLEALVTHAETLLDQFRLDESAELANQALQLSPAQPDALRILDRIERENRLAQTLHEEAKKALDSGDLTRALSALEQWRLRRPVGDELAKGELAHAHLRAGRAALRQGMPRSALDHYRAAAAFGESEHSGEALRLLKPVAVLEELKDGDLRKSKRLLSTIESNYPDRAVPVFLRAVIHHVAGEVPQAVAAYAEAARIDEESEPAEGCLSYKVVSAVATATLRSSIAHPPQAGVERWRDTFLDPLRRNDTGRYFTVFAPTDAHARNISESADEIYGRIAKELLGSVPKTGKAEIVLHPAREAYVAADPVPRGSPLASVTVRREMTGGVCLTTIGEDGKQIVRIELFLGANRLMEDTLPHEIVHVVQRRGLSAHRSGHWLDEGLAMLYESEAGHELRRQALKREAELMPLRNLLALRSTPPNEMGLFYNQSFALADYLRNLGTTSDWASFLKAYGETSFEQAIQTVYSIESTDHLEREWLMVLRAPSSSRKSLR